MEKINDAKIFSLNHENESLPAEKREEGGGDRDVGGREENESRPGPQDALIGTGESSEKAQTNLEILLSQNDILPLLKKINKENSQEVCLSKYVKNSKDPSQNKKTSGRNARYANRILENEHPSSDTEEDLEFIKVEEQPSNLQNGELKQYQMEALNWLIKLHNMKVNGILADEMGLGKTIQTISLIAYLQLQKQQTQKKMLYLVIVPKVTINNWQREFAKWLPDLRILFFYGNKEERKYLTDVSLREKNYDLILTTFECAMKEKNSLSKICYEYIIIDEAHRLKNEKAKFSNIVRQFISEHRLLLTGTPLQNNLHELWALLNFLMPKIFNDSEEFDKVFNLDSATEENQKQIVKNIHKILKPFVLRRLKSEVEFKLPSKKEIYLYVSMSELQKSMYKQILTKNIDLVNGVNKDKIQLLNILMQLKKVCNHPYLFPKVEEGPPYVEGDHLINNAMKLKVLDVLLKKIYNENGKVLIFSQMTSLLNILDDYCRFKGFRYCRIDGSTSSEDRDSRIEDFQSPHSDKFIFLLSTRAGGLGINLHAANNVIIYDSDWNPQVDLQAIDRAHRIGQTRPVKIYRFVTEGSVEEKIVERAAKKLKIDHLIIQKGKAIQNKVSALEMTNIIQHGADKLFSLNESSTEKDIEEVLEYSMNKTEKLNEHLKTLEDKLNINNLSLSTDTKDIYQYEGEDYKKKYQEESSASQMLINLSYSLGQRERKLINSSLDDKSKKQDYKKPKLPTGWRAKVGGGYSHQFFDADTLDELEDKETKWKKYLKLREEGCEFSEQKDESPAEFTEKDQALKNELLKQGYLKWTKKDFTKFLRAAEVYGLDDSANISKYMRSKTLEDVEGYVSVFRKKVYDMPSGNRIMIRLNRYESEKSKNIEYQMLLDALFEKLAQDNNNIFKNLEIPYRNKGKIQGDLFSEEDDKYLICLLFKYGYKNWNIIRNHILGDPRMKFNISLRIKNEQDLQERSNYLLNCFKVETSRKKKEDDKKNKKKSASKKLSKKKKKKSRK